MPRIVLLMPTHTYRAEAFLSAAGRLGLQVTVATEQEQVLAPLTPGATLALDFGNPARAREQVRAFAREYPVDAVVGVDDEVAILAAQAAEALGLPHNSVESVKAARYKDVMRLLLAETTALPTPWFELVGIHEDPWRAAERLQFPCVVKPLSLSASRGVIRADDAQQFVAAFRTVVEILGEAGLAPDEPAAHQVLVEEFIPGREVALEGLLEDGELRVLALFDKPDPLDGPYFEETLYVTPSRLPEDVQATIAATTHTAAVALGLRRGPIHAELRLNERGAWIVEIAPRSIGGQCSRSLRFDLDLSLEEIILSQAAGVPLPTLRRERGAAGALMIPIPRGGILHGVDGLEATRALDGIEQVTISIACGQRVVPLPLGNRYLGFVVARGETPERVEASLRAAQGLLRFDIREPEEAQWETALAAARTPSPA